MKTLILVILVCCSPNEKTYDYEAKNVQNGQTGHLYSDLQYNQGDTVVIDLNK